MVFNLSCLQVEKKMSNNVNKALVIDYSDSRLISCGSLFQGKNTNFVAFFVPSTPKRVLPGAGKRNWVRTDLLVTAYVISFLTLSSTH